jgi:transcriptional regulator with XRE-family HTH domain
MSKRQPQAVFGQIIRKFRSERLISQETLADAAGLHRTYISLLERGLRNPSLTVVHQVAVALKVPMTDLIAEFEDLMRKKGG